MPLPAPVLSTYRLQMRGHAAGDAFTFADAEKVLDYLSDLGVSHLYLSPILTSAPGSEHGYDVVDPTTVDPDLGGADGFAALAGAARSRGMGVIVDIVPNHLGVGMAEHNPWWWDVLMHGRDSTYATYFDIDWSADPNGRILLPILGSDEDLAALTVDGDVLRVHGMSFPIAPGTDGGTGTAVHDRQHYRLTGWRSGACGYRRFFSITSLAGLRQEDPDVFAHSHAEVGRWFSEGLTDGVRIDHPDGLTDPTGYLSRLREFLGTEAWIVIEKILSPGEPLDPSLPIAGTTGYDALREIGGVFVDPSGAATLTALAESAGFVSTSTPELLRELKARAVTETLASELARLCRVIGAAAGRTDDRLPDAVVAVLVEIGLYRTDYRALSQVLSAAIAAAVTRRSDLTGAVGVLADGLILSEEAAARFQQLCGAMTAKAVEDCYYYRDPRLVSLNEVGGDPQRFGVSSAEFHRSAAVRAQLWPQTMVALSTHDTKRGEDVRARIGVLSQVPALWEEMIGRWEAAAPSPDRLTGLFLWQNIFGVWPPSGGVDEALRARFHRYAEKSIREAGLRTSWNEPDPAFEEAVHCWLDRVLDGPVAAELSELVAQLSPHAQSDALGQKLLALTVPGVPDVYQGTELWEDSLVDPDNRRPVDYTEARRALHGSHPKMRVVTAALHSRRDRPDTYLAGGYRPMPARGPAAEHLLAFERGADVIVAVTRWSVRLSECGWQETVLPLPDGVWTDRITGRSHAGNPAAADLFGELPVALLERADG